MAKKEVEISKLPIETMKNLWKTMNLEYKEIERRIDMTIKNYYHKAGLLKDVDEYLQNRIESFKKDKEYNENYLKEERENEKYKDTSDEEFKACNEWRYEQIEHNNELIAVAESLRIDLIKLLK